MTQRFRSLFMQDLLLSYRNGYVLVTAVLLAIMIALVQFLPDEINIGPAEFIFDATPGQALEASLLAQGAAAESFVDSRAALESALADAQTGVGIVVDGTLAAPQVTFLTEGRIAEQNLNLLRAVVDGQIAALRDDGQAVVAVEQLRPSTDPIPLNKKFLPVAVVFEVIIIGYLLVAVMIFEEKQEGTNRAFRVSPAGTWSYLLSKNALFVVMGLLYGGLLMLYAFGFGINYLNLLVVIGLGTLLMSLVGMTIAVFFNNITEWFFVGIGIMIPNLLPAITYAVPAFSPEWMRFIPSYPILFGVREILFPTGDTGFMLPLLGYLLVANGVMLLLAYTAVQRKLMQA